MYQATLVSWFVKLSKTSPFIYFSKLSPFIYLFTHCYLFCHPYFRLYHPHHLFKEDTAVLSVL